VPLPAGAFGLVTGVHNDRPQMVLPIPRHAIGIAVMSDEPQADLAEVD
jgi:hypothetical protein